MVNEIIHPFQRLQSQLADLIASTPTGGRLPAEPELAKELVRSFLNAKHIDLDRYNNRINKFKAIETEFFK
mgnify:CR=1 FL=1